MKSGQHDVNVRVRLRNQVWLRSPGWSQTLGLAWEEGRATADLAWTRSFRESVGNETEKTTTTAVQWFTVTDTNYLEPGRYDDAGTVELQLTGRLARKGFARFALEAGVLVGYAYPEHGSTQDRTGYSRLMVTGSSRIPVTSAWSLGVRLYGGLTLAEHQLPRQRRITLAGADPYQVFTSPLLRSRGALLARPEFYYHAPGGAGLRGLDPGVTADDAVGGSLEAEYAILRGKPGSFLSRVAAGVFGDAALANGGFAHRMQEVADAGVGLRLDQQLGGTPWQTRLDFPLWVSRPRLAQDHGPNQPIGFRWVFSFNPAF